MEHEEFGVDDAQVIPICTCFPLVFRPIDSVCLSSTVSWSPVVSWATFTRAQITYPYHFTTTENIVVSVTTFEPKCFVN